VVTHQNDTSHGKGLRWNDLASNVIEAIELYVSGAALQENAFLAARNGWRVALRGGDIREPMALPGSEGSRDLDDFNQKQDSGKFSHDCAYRHLEASGPNAIAMELYSRV
jgi:hypothetical protein